LKTVKETSLKDMILRVVEQEGDYIGVLIADDQIKARIEGDNVDDVWRRLHAQAAASSPKFHGFGDAKKRFLRIFRRGFRSPAYAKHERTYKLEAMKALEAAVPLEEALEGTGHAEAILSVFRKTNLLSPFEQIKVQTLLRSRQADAFIRGAAKMAAGEVATGLAQMRTAAGPHDAARWTTVTYLPFLWRPKEHMFLKPSVTCDFAERVGHRFCHEYRAALEPEVYRSLLDLAQVTAQELAELKPADNIDIQSFIWTVCTYDEDAEQGLDREVREAREPRETREVREPREVDA
jgi:hypothetical protein